MTNHTPDATSVHRAGRRPPLFAMLTVALVTSVGAQTKPATSPANVQPQYGGSLNVLHVYSTVSPLSFDAADWLWKFNQDTGLTYESLFAADLSKAKRLGGKYNFVADGWLPTDAIRGELAEKWELKQNPMRLEVNLRKSVMFPAKEGVMAARELTAEDVVYSFNRYDKSPKKIPGYFDHIEKIEATGRHSLVMTFKRYDAEWDYRFGWGYYSAIVPREVAEAGAKDWKKVNGTGPYALTNYVTGNTLTFTRNPNYWDSERIGGKEYKLPFTETINYRVIKDETTSLAALRTGKVDIMEAVRWGAVDELKKSTPQLQWNRYLTPGAHVLSLRNDIKPFNDVRVRRALNMAVDKQAIIKSYFGGHAEMLAFPMYPGYEGYYEPLSAMPDSVKELFTYNPAKAKQLLVEAGYPNGFSFKTQMSSVSIRDQDLLALVSAYLAKVGVKMEIQVMELPAFMSTMMNKTHAPGHYAFAGTTNPTTALRKSYLAGHPWNASLYSDPDFDKKIAEVYAESNESIRQTKIKLMTREILDNAPQLWLPTHYSYTAWWPWVKNYGGELRAGGDRPGPIHARVWIDQSLKKSMGY